MFNNNVKLMFIMEGQLEYFKLNTISIPHNLLVFGDIRKIQLFWSNIKYVLRDKSCTYSFVNIHENMCIKYYSKEYKQFGYVIVYDTLDYHPKSFSPLDTIFIHSQYIHKESVMKNFLENRPVNDLINYSDPETYFVLPCKLIFKLYKAESFFAHSLDFNAKPFDYNNIIKLTNYILNDCSVYHKINDFLHLKIQLRMKQLNQIYCGILCLKHNKLRLPDELIFEIMKLFVSKINYDYQQFNFETNNSNKIEI